MTQREVAKLIAVMIAAFPNCRPHPSMTQVYEKLLVDLRHPTATAAIKALLGQSRFMPTIAEIREAYELERDRERREADKRALPPAPLPDSAERVAWARGVVEQLAQGFKPPI